MAKATSTSNNKALGGSPTTAPAGMSSTITSTSSSGSTPPSSGTLSSKALLFMALLAFQFGIQPIVTKRYTSGNIIKSTVIFMQEIVKLVIGATGIVISGQRGREGWGDVTKGWSIISWLRLSLLPATIYLIQNMCSLLAYQNLDAITYNVLNQTKTLSAAMCCYIILGKRQSGMQIVALLLLLVAALVMEKIVNVEMLRASYWMVNTSVSARNESEKGDDSIGGNLVSFFSSRHVSHGVVPIMTASFLSGLAGAITQKSLQVGNRHALLFTVELCVASLLVLLLSFLRSEDGHQIYQRGFFSEWTVYTFIPIITNAAGGILVGLVIKFAGTVRKGFALIFGILLSGILQSLMSGEKNLTAEEMVGGALAGVSLWMHSSYPYRNERRSLLFGRPEGSWSAKNFWHMKQFMQQMETEERDERQRQSMNRARLSGRSGGRKSRKED